MPSVFNKFIVGKVTKNPATHKGIAGLFLYYLLSDETIYWLTLREPLRIMFATPM